MSPAGAAADPAPFPHEVHLPERRRREVRQENLHAGTPHRPRATFARPPVQAKLPSRDRLQHSGLPGVVTTGEHHRVEQLESEIAEALEAVDSQTLDHVPTRQAGRSMSAIGREQ